MRLRALNRILIGFTFFALILTFGTLYPFFTSTAEQMRFRNSLIVEIGDDSAFDWPPYHSPPNFYTESSEAPDDLAKIAAELTATNSEMQRAWQIALELSDHLAQGPGVGERIQSTTEETYKKILSEKSGYCADYRRAFTGLAHAVKIPVRLWGMTFDDFGENGHAFNEVFSPQWNKWIFLDSYYSFYVEDSNAGVPLSVLELNRKLRGGTPFSDLQVVRITPERFPFHSDEAALKYYEKGLAQMFLLTRNDVFTYDKHAAIQALAKVSRKVEQIGAIALGIFPKILVIPSDESRLAVDRLRAKRNRYLGATFLLLLLGVILWAEISAYRYQKAK